MYGTKVDTETRGLFGKLGKKQVVGTPKKSRTSKTNKLAPQKPETRYIPYKMNQS